MEEKVTYASTDKLAQVHFQDHAIWCPYQYPWELDEFLEWEDSYVQLREQILALVAEFHVHPCYPLPKDVPVGRRDLVYVAVDAEFPSGIRKAGYLVMSDGEPSCLNVFEGSDKFTFYNDPAEPEENQQPVFSLLGHQLQSRIRVRIFAHLSPPDLPIPDFFDIPDC